MAYYAIVIDDPDLAHRQEQIRHKRRYPVKRVAGDIHDHLDEGCPLCGCGCPLELHLDDGSCLGCDCTTPKARPNCRHCGDPAHAAACRKHGHCEFCGTRHGIAPESVLKANGYRLIKIDGAPPPGHVWHIGKQKFIPGE